ncbi:VOC family protein [Jatrophihabitans sp. DSM 45814]
MAATLNVERLGHVNVFADDYDAVLAVHRDVFGAKVFREWEEVAFGGKNALWLIGGTCIEIFAATSPDLAIGQWVGKNGPGWHSMEWTVPSLNEAIQTITERGIRITDRVEGAYVFTHPKDLHGVCLELTEHHFDNDDRDVAGWQPTYWSDEHPLGITGPATIKIASKQPAVAAADVAALVGRETYTRESPQLNAMGHGIAFADHALEFVGSRTNSTTDLIGGFIERHGARMFCTTFTVADFDKARRYLVESDIRFTQFGRLSLLIDPDVTHGALIELAA